MYLSLEKKVEIIKHTQSNPGLSLRYLEIIFGCGKTQIGKILKNKESILASYQSNASGSRVHTISKACNSEYSEINDALYKWFVLARSKNIPVGGQQLIEKAKMIAATLGKPEFKGSQGWLEKWKKRFAIKELKICGESGEIQGETVDSWKERLPEIVQGYSKDNIWNMDETGLFFRALPDRGFAQKRQSCKGGKKSKLRVTIALFVSASGHKEKPVFIWKSENPRCLRGFDKSCLPVSYYSQRKAWMSGEILEDILTKLNRRLLKSNRNILLLMDNAGCHPEGLVSKFSNIKIIFLPANTTCVLQPLDLGIIQAFNMYYRKRFLSYVVSKIDECDQATDVMKSVNVLVALRWVAQAWNEVKSDTITKCFRKAGVLNDVLEVVGLDQAGADGSVDPFADIDEDFELQYLIEQTRSESCIPREFISGDDDLPICVEMDDENWENTFLEELTAAEGEAEDASQEIDEDDEFDDGPVVPRLKSYKKAINSLEDVCQFLEHRGHGIEALSIGSSIDRIVALKNSNSRQATLYEYVTQ